MSGGTSVWKIIGSIRTVNQWSASAESNIGNSQRVGYKQYEVNFGGGLATTL